MRATRANVASQRVLRSNGFVPFGVAQDFLKIGGRWQDHVLFQVIARHPGLTCSLAVR